MRLFLLFFALLFAVPAPVAVANFAPAAVEAYGVHSAENAPIEPIKTKKRKPLFKKYRSEQAAPPNAELSDFEVFMMFFTSAAALYGFIVLPWGIAAFVSWLWISGAAALLLLPLFFLIIIALERFGAVGVLFFGLFYVIAAAVDMIVIAVIAFSMGWLLAGFILVGVLILGILALVFQDYLF